MLSVSVLVKGMEERPGVLGWLIRMRLVQLEEVDDAMNLSLRERTVGIYDETTKSDIHNPRWYAEPYIPAAWSGRNVSGPVGHHHIRLQSDGFGGDWKRLV
jgi:hypothetical protein